MEKQFLNIEDILPVGKHIINVRPLPEFQQVDGKWKPIDGTHQCGIIKSGGNKGAKFYKYNTDITYFDRGANKTRTCQIFAWNAKDKAILDKGRVEVNIVEKPILLDNEPVYTKDGNIAVKRMFYVNPVPEQGCGNKFKNIPEYNNPAFVSPIEVDDIPIIDEEQIIDGEEVKPTSQTDKKK